jgi:hypothetical protein
MLGFRRKCLPDSTRYCTRDFRLDSSAYSSIVLGVPPSLAIRFLVAFSFSGENREEVRKLAEAIKALLGQGNVFFDEWFQEEIMGPDMDLYLEDIYHSQSLLIVHDISQSYADRAWTQSEWRAVRALKHKLREVGDKNARWRTFPVRYQDGNVPGIYDIDGVPDARKMPLSELAGLIRQRVIRLQTMIESAPPLTSMPPPVWRSGERDPIDDQPFPPSQLPTHADSALVGRENEIAFLDRAWMSEAPKKVNIVSVVAFGGQGKTAVVKNWMARLAQQGWREGEFAADWSFYSQGSSSNRAAGADTFVAWALRWLGDPTPNTGTPWERGSRLGALLGKRRILLVLDGLEPLQFPPGADEGKIKDPLISAMLLTLARHNKGLCVITTRQQVRDLRSFEDTTCPRHDLGQLSLDAGVALLSGMGVQGSKASFQAVVEELRGHALTLTLLGRFIHDSQPGRHIRHWKKILAHGTLHGEVADHTRKVLGSYVEWLGAQSPACSLLRLLGLFDRPAEQESLRALCQRPVLSGLTESLADLDEGKWRQVIEQLRVLGLTFDPAGEDGCEEEQPIDCHPLVREYFRRELQKDRNIWLGANLRLFHHYKSQKLRTVSRIDDLQPMFFAVVHGCRALRYREAFSDVYLPQLVRGDEFFAVQSFGALGSLLSVLAHFFEGNEWGIPVAQSREVPDGLDNQQQSVVLNHAIALLTETDGYSSSHAAQCIQTAQRLASTLVDRASQYPLTVAVWRDAVGSETVQATEVHARNVMRLAKSLKSDSAMLGAYRTEGLTAFIAGNFLKVRRVAKAGIALARTKDAYTRAMIHSVEPSISCHSYLSLALWHLGKTDTALHESAHAFRKAESFPHMHTAVVTRYWQQFLWHFLNDAGRVQHEAGRLLELAVAHGFKAWAAAARVFHGWAFCRVSGTIEGLSEVVEGIDGWRDARLKTFVPYFKSMQADCLSRHDPTAAARLLQNAELMCRERGELWWLPEIQRMSAAVGLSANSARWAGDRLKEALQSARHIKSRALELRILSDLAGHSRIWIPSLRKVRKLFPAVPSSADELRAHELLLQAKGTPGRYDRRRKATLP